MTTTRRVGRRLRAIAARVCGAGATDAMERVIDPLIADLQMEHGEALQQGRPWRARWIRVSAGIAFLKVLAWCGGVRLLAAASTESTGDGRVVGRTIAYSGIASALWIGVFMLLVWLNLPSMDARKWGAAAILAIPHTIPMSVPIGFALGVVVAFGGRAVSRRSMRVVLGLAFVGTIMAFAMMLWGVAAANTAFQRAVFDRPVRGVNELTMFELRERLWPSPNAPVARQRLFGRGDRAYLERSYYMRWGVSFGTLVLGLLGLAVLHRGRVVRVGVALVGGVAYMYYYYFMTRLVAEDIAVPAVTMAWLPNVMIAVAAGTMLLVRSRRAA